MKQTSLGAAAGTVILLLSGCRKEAMPAPAPPAAGPREAAVSLLMPRFRPPSDGRLTPEQLDRYVRVRRAARGRTDRDAARALGVDPDEFFWVRGRVFEALVELEGQKVRSASDAVYARTVGALRESRKSARDPATARTLDEQIAGLERERAAIRKPETPPASVLANARLVGARRADIDSVSP